MQISEEFGGHCPDGDTVLIPVIDIFMGQGAVEINAVPLMEEIILAIEIDRQGALQHIATFLAPRGRGAFYRRCSLLLR